MKIHAIQTGSVAIKESQRSGSRGNGPIRLLNTLMDRRWTEQLPIYAWVIEHPEGILIVDTGETARTSDPGYFPWWHPYYRRGVRLHVRPEDEVGPQLQNIGIAPADVRWVVMTHLHTDHAGGLSHFPKAEILVSRGEYDQASGWMGQISGFLPQHWPAWFAPRLVDFNPTPIGPFPESFTLAGAGDVHLVPTPGHTRGHMSVILERCDLAYFFAGDVSYTEELMRAQVVDGVTFDNQVARRTLARTLAYVQGTPTVYLPSHDPGAGDRLASG
jgi:glyoxylase-like metal-dependent hydrolase (beta-lactamase superfamily II)